MCHLCKFVTPMTMMSDSACRVSKTWYPSFGGSDTGSILLWPLCLLVGIYGVMVAIWAIVMLQAWRRK